MDLWRTVAMLPTFRPTSLITDRNGPRQDTLRPAHPLDLTIQSGRIIPEADRDKAERVSTCTKIEVTENKDLLQRHQTNISPALILKAREIELPIRSTNNSELNKGVTPELAGISREEVSCHCDSSSCWLILWDRVYDLTDFVRQHPGGEDVVLENAGRDATVPFQDVGHSKGAISMLQRFCIGILRQADRINCNGTSSPH